jgi:membrane fusion protein, multidrug efflux system
VKASKGDIGVYITDPGGVAPVYTVTVMSQISGYLMQVLYKEGDMVRQGEALAEIDPRPYQVMLEQAQAAMARDQANLDNARVDLQRYQTLVPLRAVPEQTFATQQALVKSDEGTVQTDQAQIDSAKLDLVYCHITSPITGRVGLRLVDPGNYVQTSSALVVVTQLQPITAVFPIAEDQLPAVIKKWRAGERLSVDALDRNMKKLASGSLSTIDNQIDPTTGTVKLRATFQNQDFSLFPNQFVNARLLVEEKHGVTLVPTAAIQRNNQQTYVWFVKPDSTVTVRQIKLGTTEGDESEVTSGLEPGDTVVMTGVDRLQEGSKVNAQLEGARPAPAHSGS